MGFLLVTAFCLPHTCFSGFVAFSHSPLQTLFFSPHVLNSSPEIVEWGRSLERTFQATKPCHLQPQPATEQIFRAQGPEDYYSTQNPKHLPSPCFAPTPTFLCVVCWLHCFSLRGLGRLLQLYHMILNYFLKNSIYSLYGRY